MLNQYVKTTDLKGLNGIDFRSFKQKQSKRCKCMYLRK